MTGGGILAWKQKENTKIKDNLKDVFQGTRK